MKSAADGLALEVNVKNMAVNTYAHDRIARKKQKTLMSNPEEAFSAVDRTVNTAQRSKGSMGQPKQQQKSQGRSSKDEDHREKRQQQQVMVGKQKQASKVFLKWCSVTTPILGHSVSLDDRIIVLGDVTSAKDVCCKYRGQFDVACCCVFV
jgi:NADPH-dependent glutamate synthase beta subunit-like oxidoreductase